MKKIFSLILFALVTVSVGWSANYYAKVTSVDQLVAGKKYILVYEDPGTSSSTNNRVATSLSTRFTTTTIKKNKFINDAVNIDGVSNVSQLTLGSSEFGWTLSLDGTNYVAASGQNSDNLKKVTDPSLKNAQWTASSDGNGFILTNAEYTGRTIQKGSSNNYFYCYQTGTNLPVYLYVHIEHDMTVSTNDLDMGYKSSDTFTVNGTGLIENVSVTIDAGSDEGFSVSPDVLVPEDRDITDAQITVTYEGTNKDASATITVKSGDLTQVVNVTAKIGVTVYIDKSSTGNLYAWNTDETNNGWPGVDISTLPTATVEGTEYYAYTFSGEAKGLIFNRDGNQTGDITPAEGDIYKYNGENGNQGTWCTSPVSIGIAGGSQGYVYIYDKCGDNDVLELLGAWPGTDISTLTLDSYYYPIDLWLRVSDSNKTYTQGIILNDGQGGEGHQTDNLPIIDGRVSYSYPIEEGVEVNEINFPDPVFREFVAVNYDKNHTGVLTEDEIAKIKMLSLWANSSNNYAEIQSLQGIEFFTNMSCLNTQGLVNVTEIDLSKNAEKLDSVWIGMNIQTLDVSMLANMTDLRFLSGCEISNQVIDLSSNTKMTELITNAKTRNNVFKGVNDIKTWTYIMADYNKFEGDTLYLEGCDNLWNLSVIGCNLYKLRIKDCEQLGIQQPGNPNKGNIKIYSNLLSAIDYDGIVCSSSVINSGQSRREVRPEVSKVDRIEENGKIVGFRYHLYLNLCDERPEWMTTSKTIVQRLVNYFKTSGSKPEKLVYYDSMGYTYTDANQAPSYDENVRWTDFTVSRVPESSWHWVSGDGENQVEVIHGQAQNSGTRAATPADVELDPDKIYGDVLSLGVYDVMVDEPVIATGRVGYTYTTNFEGTMTEEDLARPERDMVNYPFEIMWTALLTGDPDQVETAIDEVENAVEIADVTYYNIMGVASSKPFDGVNIKVTRYSNGKVLTTKVIR